jgi:4-diphosphocytidyl-2-C-methyl-D-erythritol kinase
MQGVGETITPCPLPPTPAVLVNPGIALATAAVFCALQSRHNPAMPPSVALPNPASLATWLQSTRNDLQPPAIGLVPQIAGVLADLQSQDHCRLARMSGSGATCFGLFDTAQQAEAAARALRRSQPSWWVQSTILT